MEALGPTFAMTHNGIVHKYFTPLNGEYSIKQGTAVRISCQASKNPNEMGIVQEVHTKVEGEEDEGHGGGEVVGMEGVKGAVNGQQYSRFKRKLFTP